MAWTELGIPAPMAGKELGPPFIAITLKNFPATAKKTPDCYR